MAIVVNSEACVGCKVCVDMCPHQAISVNDDDKAVIHQDRCEEAKVCINVCPVEAIREE